jgi:hypothetical protein
MPFDHSDRPPPVAYAAVGGDEADSTATEARDTAPSITGYSDFTFIGGGATSTVWRAYEAELDRWVAIKVLRPGFSHGADRDRFDREKRISGKLGRYDNIVQIHVTGSTDDDGRAYMAMDLCEHGSLSSRIATQGTFAVAETVGIGIKIAAALQKAHAADVVHRDIKPENILLSDFGPALTDFGIARAASSTEWTESRLWLSVAHAAPEAFLDDVDPSHTADVYSLGSTLYTMLAGHPAFKLKPRERHSQFVLRLERDPVPPIRRADVPASLMAVIERAMAKEPGDRYASAAELEAALRDVALELGLDGASTGTAPSVADTTAVADGASTAELWAQTAPDGPEPTRTIPDERADATVVRERRGSAPAAEPEVTQSSPGRSRLLIGASVAVLAVVGIGGAVAMGGGGSGDGERESSTTAATEPIPVITEGAPANLQVTDGGTIADLTWDDTSGGAADFVVGVFPEGGELETARVEEGLTAFSVTGLDPDRKYCFLVNAILPDDQAGQAVAQASKCIRGGSLQTPTGD